MNPDKTSLPPTLESLLNLEQLDLLRSLDHPVKIQAFLDSVPYSAEDRNRSPLEVLRDRQAHCLDGALFAAAALRRLGYPPVVLDMFPDPGMDDDHVLAIFKRHGRYGAIAKSNFVGLRYREPVYRTLRELVMSYFDDFFNVNGVKTLRSYTRPVQVQRFDRENWEVQEAGVDAIEAYLLRLPRRSLLVAETASELQPVDRLSYQAGMLNVNHAGLYKPKA
jgi:hypothetical protein